MYSNIKERAEFHIFVTEKITLARCWVKKWCHSIGMRDHHVNAFPQIVAETCRKHIRVFFVAFPAYLLLSTNRTLQRFIICLLSHWTPNYFSTEAMPFDTKIITCFYHVLRNDELQQWRWALKEKTRSRLCSIDLVKELDSVRWAFSPNYCVQEIVKNLDF